MNEEDVRLLRESGFSDLEILSINAVTAYMNFVNRVAQGLGVSLEEHRTVFTW
jgi:alkylhydroperoxidase family enzyme